MKMYLFKWQRPSIVLLFSLFISMNIFAQTGINGVNATASTYEYDNLITTYRSGLAKQTNGNYVVWGEGVGPGDGSINATPNFASPVEVNSTNFPGLTGSILKMAMGASTGAPQVFCLTTNGLYCWGRPGAVVSNSILGNNNAVALLTPTGAQPTGLPTGVSPSDVKMLFATNGVLAITTNGGNVYILATNASMRGNGQTGTTTAWATPMINVSTSLTNIVACRGNNTTMMAINTSGQIYTWGTHYYVGNGTSQIANPITSLSYATLMTLPAGKQAKIIQCAKNTTQYFVSTDNILYSIGKGDGKYANGLWTTSETLVWANPTKTNVSTDIFNNVAMISTPEHDGSIPPRINVLLADGKLYAFGDNTDAALGTMTSTANSANCDQNGEIITAPPLMSWPQTPKDIAINDKVTYVETGSLFSIIYKEGNANYCYTGDFGNGSKGDGTIANLTTGAGEYCGYYCLNNTASVNGGTVGSGLGTLECLKTQISPAPVAGTPSQVDLMVTINVTTPGVFPVTINGSGMTLANEPMTLTASATGIQSFHIPLKYDGTALGTLNFTIGTAGSCSANLTTTPKDAIIKVWTLDCVPTLSPNLKQ